MQTSIEVSKTDDGGFLVTIKYPSINSEIVSYFTNEKGLSRFLKELEK